MNELKELLKLFFAGCICISFIVGQVCFLYFSIRYSSAREGALIGTLIFFSMLLILLVFYFSILLFIKQPNDYNRIREQKDKNKTRR